MLVFFHYYQTSTRIKYLRMESQVDQRAEAGNKYNHDCPWGLMPAEGPLFRYQIVQHEAGQYPVDYSKKDDPDYPFQLHILPA